MATSNFEEYLIVSRLVSTDDIASTVASLSSERGTGPPAEALAARLIEAGLITSWQAKSLLRGETRFFFGPYRVEYCIGIGATHWVYHVRERDSGTQAALRVPFLKQETIAEFFRRVRVQAKQRDGRLARVLGHTRNPRFPAAGIEYLCGVNLRDKSRREGRLTEAAAARAFIDVANAVECLHENGFVHCNLKPVKINISASGGGSVTDVGLALPHGATADFPNGDQRPSRFFAPELQLSQARARRANDVFSLGSLLYYAVTATEPPSFRQRKGPVRTWVLGSVFDARRSNPAVTEKFALLLDLMMSPDPGDRPDSALSVAGELQRFV